MDEQTTAQSKPTLTERFLDGNERALARAISLIEAGDANGQTLLKKVRPHAGRARIVGVTGSPGSGKSTLVDRLIGAARARERRVAVIAVDPTSPYSGGAILGDRIRMMRWHQDPGVYIRSMATRGHLGGLAAATLQVVALLDAYGFDDILVETVGVGQSEVEIIRVSDTTLLVLTPGQGDGVQAFKAGIMEIADAFVINKFDQPGGPRLKREIRAALDLAHPSDVGWSTPIVETIASQGEGTDAVIEALDAHHEHLSSKGELSRRRKARIRAELAALLGAQLRRQLSEREDVLVDAILRGELSPNEALEHLWSTLTTSGDSAEAAEGTTDASKPEGLH